MVFVRSFIGMVLNILEVAIIIRVIISWLPLPKDNQIVAQVVNVVYMVTEPMLGPVRKMIEKFSSGRSMMIDISPIVVFFLIQLLRQTLNTAL